MACARKPEAPPDAELSAGRPCRLNQAKESCLQLQLLAQRTRFWAHEHHTHSGHLLTLPLSPQLAAFRRLLCTPEGHVAAFLLSNHRPPQPLKGRQVRASFH